MNTQIVYASKAGHAKKAALALGQMLQFPIAHVSENPDLSNTDMLCLIGEIRDGDCLPELLSYVKNLRAKEVKMATIITCAANTDDSQIMLRKLLEQKNILVNGENNV